MQDQGQHPLPWFGAIQGLVLVPPQHSLDARNEPTALITLNEGGQLIVYDMKTLQPLPLSLPLQELPPVTASAFVDNTSPPEVGHKPIHPPEHLLRPSGCLLLCKRLFRERDLSLVRHSIECLRVSVKNGLAL